MPVIPFQSSARIAQDAQAAADLREAQDAEEARRYREAADAKLKELQGQRVKKFDAQGGTPMINVPAPVPAGGARLNAPGIETPDMREPGGYFSDSYQPEEGDALWNQFESDRTGPNNDMGYVALPGQSGNGVGGPQNDIADPALEAIAQDMIARQKERAGAADEAMNRTRALNAPNPDQAAQAQELAGKTGANRLEVLNNLDTYKRADLADRLDGLQRLAPKLRTWLDFDPQNFEVAHDDVENLGWWEQLQQSFARTDELKAQRGKRDGAGLGALTDYPLGDNFSPGVANMAGVVEGGKAIGQSLAAGYATTSSGVAGLLRSPLEINDQFASWVAGRKIESGASQYMTRLQTAAQSAAADWRYKSDDPTIQGLLSGVESLPTSAFVIAATMVTGGTAAPLFGAATGGALTAGDKYGEMRSQGANPLDSTGVALAHGILETAFEIPELKWLVGDLEHGVPFLQMMYKQAAVQVVTENGASLTQDFVDWAFLPENKGKPFQEYLDGRFMAAYQTTLAALVGTGIQTTGAKALDTAMLKIDEGYQQKRAEDIAKFISGMGDNANTSKLLKRGEIGADKYREVVAAAVKDTPRENVRINPEGIAELAQSQGVTPEQLAQAFRIDPETMVQAMDTGDDIIVPSGNFAAVIQTAKKDIGVSGETIYQALAPHIRLNDKDFTARESEVFQKIAKASEDAQAEWNTAENDFVASSEAVTIDIQDQIRAMGRYNEDTTDTLTKMMAQIVNVWAKQTQQDPAEVWKSQGFNIISAVTGEQQDEGAVLPQGAELPADATPTQRLIDMRAKGSSNAEIATALYPDVEAKTAVNRVKALASKHKGKIEERQAAIEGAATLAQDPASPPNEGAKPFDMRSLVRPIEDIRRAHPDVNVEYAGTGTVYLTRNGKKVRVATHGKRLFETDEDAYKVRLGEFPSANDVDARAPDAIQQIRAKLDLPPDPLAHGGEQPNATITLNRTRALIRMFEGANLSSLAHEGAHWYLDLLFRMSKSENPHPFVKAQMARILEFAGKSQEWDGMFDAKGDFTEEGRKLQEQFAEAFEVYLMTGKAPSVGMRSVFNTFKQWILGVYKAFKKGVGQAVRDVGPYTQARIAAKERELGRRMNDQELVEFVVPQELRDVFDRMLATEDAINAAQTNMVRDSEAMAKAMLEKLDPDGKWKPERQQKFMDRMRERYAEAKERAEAALMARLMDEYTRARSTVAREEERDIRQEVASEIDEQPAQRVYQVLSGQGWRDTRADQANAQADAADVMATLAQMVSTEQRQAWQLERGAVDDTVYFFGTYSAGVLGDIENYDLSKAGSQSGSGERAMFLTTSSKRANTYADPGMGSANEYFTREEDPARWEKVRDFLGGASVSDAAVRGYISRSVDTPGVFKAYVRGPVRDVDWAEYTGSVTFDDEAMKRLIDEEMARPEGPRNLRITNIADGGNDRTAVNMVVLDPDNVMNAISSSRADDAGSSLAQGGKPSRQLEDDPAAFGLTPEQAKKVNPIYRPKTLPVERLASNQDAALWLESNFIGDPITDLTAELSDEQINEIAIVMAAEAQLALRDTGNAFTWYSSALAKALDIISIKYPMLDDDAAAAEAGFGTSANARFAFTFIMAVTSQNLDVAANSVATDKAFADMLKRVRDGDFTMPRSWGTGDKQKAMGENFAKFGPLIDKMPGDDFPSKLEALDDLFRIKMTVKEWVSFMKARGIPYNAPGQTAMDAVVYGSSLLGPKIGNGFWQNLNGNYSPLTIDLWMRRTWGRLTGYSIGNPGALPDQRARLKASIGRSRSRAQGDADAIASEEKRRDDLKSQLVALKPEAFANKKAFTAEQTRLKKEVSVAGEIIADLQNIKAPEAWKAEYGKDDKALLEYSKRILRAWDQEYKRLREELGESVPADLQPTWARAAKTIVTNLAKPLDQVANGTQRKQIERAGQEALQILEARGVKLTTADLQAILWYPEKELWGALTAEMATDEDGVPIVPPNSLNESYDTAFGRILREQGYEVQGTAGDGSGGPGAGTVSGQDAGPQRSESAARSGRSGNAIAERRSDTAKSAGPQSLAQGGTLAQSQTHDPAGERELDALGFYSAVFEAAKSVRPDVWSMGWDHARNSIVKGGAKINGQRVAPRESEMAYLGLDEMFYGTKLKGAELAEAVLSHIQAKRLLLVENFAKYDPKRNRIREALEAYHDYRMELADKYGREFGLGQVMNDDERKIWDALADDALQAEEKFSSEIRMGETREEALARLERESNNLVRGPGDIRLPGEDVPLFESVIGLPEGVPGSDYQAPGSHVGGKAKGTLVTAHGEERIDDKGQRTLFTGQVQSDMAQQAREAKQAEEANKAVIEGSKINDRQTALDYLVSISLGYPRADIEALYAKYSDDRVIASAHDKWARRHDMEYQPWAADGIDLDAPLLSTSEWTNVGVRAMVYRAARDGFASVSFPTSETSEIIQGNDTAAGHYDTNVRGALEKIGKQLGGEMRKGAVKYDNGVDVADWSTQYDKGSGGWIITSETNDVGSIDAFKTKAEAERYIAENLGSAEPASAYILDITPEMRRKIVSEGFPLFQTRTGKDRIAQPASIPAMRLNLDAVREQYGDEAVAALPPAVRAYSTEATDADDFVTQAKAVRQTLKKDRPKSLWKFLSTPRRIGEGNDKISYRGIRDDGGEILKIIGAKKEGVGLISDAEDSKRARSYTIEHAAEVAWAEGYFSSESPPTPQEFLDALRADFDGQAKLYARNDMPLVDEIRNAEQWAAWFDENGIDITEKDQAVLKAQIETKLSGTSENAIGPDEAAPFFGLPDGKALLEGLKQGPLRDKLIREETKRRMIERNGDTFSDGTMINEAMAYARNEIQHRQFEIELEALADAAGQRAQASLAKQTAIDNLRSKQVREVLNYNQWLTLSERWGKKAVEAAAKGDMAKAMEFARYRLINSMMYVEGKKLAEKIEKTRTHLLDYGKKTKQARLFAAGAEYQANMNGLLSDYQFRNESKKGESQRAARGAWIKAQMAGIDPYAAYQDNTKSDAEKQAEAAEQLEKSQLLATLGEGADAKGYKSLTVEEMLSVRDEADMIWKLATLKDQLLKAGERRRLTLAAQDVAAEVEANQPNEKPPEPIETDTPGYKVERSVLKYFAMHRTLQSLARQFAGGKDGGKFWNYIVRPLNEAFAKLSTIRLQMGKDVGDLFSAYTEDEKRRMFRDRQTFDFTQAGGPRMTLSKQGRLAFALNWGNDKNRRRLMDSLGLDAAMVGQVLDTLDKRDWDFVQKTWDYLDTWFPEANRVHEAVHGAPMDKEDPLKVATRFGIYSGGYYPIKFDPMLSSKTGQRQVMADSKAMTGQVGSRTAPSFSKARTKGKVTLPLRLSVLDVITSHLNQVATSIATEEAFFDAGRIIKQAEVENAIVTRHGREVYNTIVNMLVTAKFGLEGASGVLAHLRNGATVVGLGWKVGTALLQPLGISNSIVRVGGFWIAKGYAMMGSDAVTVKRRVTWATERSEFMRNRREANSPEMAALRKDLKASVIDLPIRIPGLRLTKKGMDAIKDNAFAMMANVQFYSVDVPTWYGALLKAQAAGMSEADAIAEADQAVIDAQGGGELHQTAAMQTGAGTRYAAALRLLTNFMSYMVTTYNLATQRARNARTPEQLAALAFDMVILFAVPVAGKMMLDAWTKGGGDGEDDDDPLWEKFMREEIAFLLSPFVGVSQFAGSARGDDAYGYKGPAGLMIFSEMMSLGKTVAEGKFIDKEEGGLDKNFWRPANRVAGMVFHYPASQIDASIRGAAAYFKGETDNPASFLVGPPPAN